MNHLKRSLKRLNKKSRRNGLNFDYLKGKGSEDRFEQMTNELIERHELPSIRKITRANKIEDAINKIDFKIEVSTHVGGKFVHFFINVNIKSSAGAATWFVRVHRHLGIYVVIMDDAMTKEALKKRLEEICSYELEKHHGPTSVTP